jgi:hypothetical protein
MTTMVFGDNCFGTLGAGLTASDTTLTFTSGHGARFPAVPSGSALYCCILNSSNVLEEIIVTLHVAGAESATITRAAGSTTAKAWSAGDRIEARISASQLNQFFQNNNGTPTGYYAVIEDNKASGTPGGAATSGAWRTRDIQTKITDAGTIATLVGTTQFTLQAGIYRIKWSSPANSCDQHQSRLQNITDASTAGTGSSEVSFAVTGESTRSEGICRINIASAKTFEVQHQVATTKLTNGFGVPGSFGTEVYTRVEIWKELG